MPRITYQTKRFSPGSKTIIAQADRICAEYARQGYDLTLRQLYYQFVARDLIPNRDTEYKRLGSIINDARLAGMLDWDYIVDRTRNLRALAHWNDAADIVTGAAGQFRVDKWDDQDHYVEVWIEKDALVGVLESCCPGEDVPFFSCRGYTSQSEVWGAAQRLGRRIAAGKTVTILHLGDHDPSGIDMTRDIRDRLLTFISTDAALVQYRADNEYEHSRSDAEIEESYQAAARQAANHLFIERIALNMDQVDQYNPPPNPAKITDSRAGVRRDGSIAEGSYVDVHGWESWELDALEPTVLVALIRDHIAEYRDQELWDAAVEREDEEKAALAQVGQRWDDVKAFLNGGAK